MKRILAGLFLALGLALALALPFALVGCSSTQQAVETARTAGKVAELSVPIALDALTFADSERARLVAAGLLTPDDDQRAGVAIAKGRACLEKLAAKQALVKDDIREGLAAAMLGVELVKQAGGKLPGFVDPAIEMLRAVLGES